MKLIFLHGLGQKPEDWQDVIKEVHVLDTLVLPLFSHITPKDSIDLQRMNDEVSRFLDNINEPYMLCGLSLGGVLALQQAIRKQPYLKGMIVSGAQYKPPNKYLISFQNIIFHFMPKKSFQRLNVTKTQLIDLVNSMSTLNLINDLKEVTIPFLIMCGSKDRVNLSAAKELSHILNNATLKILPNGGHELNLDQPKEFAKAINYFINNQMKGDIGS